MVRRGASKRYAGRIYAAGARFVLYWAGAFGFLATVTNCPFCGQSGCPTGTAGMGVLAGIVAGVASLFRRVFRRKTKTDATERVLPGLKRFFS